MRSPTRLLGAVVMASVALVALAAPFVATHAPEAQFSDYVYAPPMLPRVIDAGGRWRLPFVYPVRLEDRLERRYSADRNRPMPVRVLAGDSLLSVVPHNGSPWFPLGTDALGRDVFARLVLGARISLGVAVLSAAGALLLGAAAGALAGFAGGRIDDALMRVADFAIALPAIYVVLALRAALPLVLTTAQVFWTMVTVFALVGWPFVARGVRAIVAAERTREYAEAARAAGATSTRLLVRHLLPATRGYLVVQATLLLPAFIVAEATLSFVGLGFSEPMASWGLMLQEAGRGRILADAPWLLAPGVAIVAVVLSVNLAASRPVLSDVRPLTFLK